MKNLDGNKTAPYFSTFLTTDFWTQILQCVCKPSAKVFVPFTGACTVPLAGLFLGLKTIGFCSSEDLLGKADSMVGNVKKFISLNPLQAFNK